jgi:hypothetical protein
MFDFQYPVKDFGEALAVVDPTSELDIYHHNLYVNLDEIRGTRFLTSILTQLGVKDGTYFGARRAYPKILLTGHRGSGKSIELERIRQKVEGVYLTIHLSIEKDFVKLSSVEPEHIYQLLLIKLLEALRAKDIGFDGQRFKQIADLWLTDEFRTKEYKTEAKFGLGIDELLGDLKGLLSFSLTASVEDARKVTLQIKRNISEIIQKLNTELDSLYYHQFTQNSLPGGVVFLLDGTEKLSYEVAQKIFIQDAPILSQIHGAMVIASPVFSLYDIEEGVPYFSNEMFPMVKLNSPEKVDKFKEIVSRRIAESTFFEPGMLDCAARKSGGSIRIFLEIVHRLLVTSHFEKIGRETMLEVLKELGLRYFRRLDGQHKAILKESKGDYDFGDIKVKEMLFSLALIVQNGKAIINPLLVPYIEGHEDYLC